MPCITELDKNHHVNKTKVIKPHTYNYLISVVLASMSSLNNGKRYFKWNYFVDLHSLLLYKRDSVINNEIQYTP